MDKFISNSEIDTLNFAKKLARYLNKGDIIILSGDLGSGKTKFTQGILEFFHLGDEISSPTFTIVNEYLPQNAPPIYHFDVYRLSSVDEFFAIGGEEYFSNGICIIEWGELLEDILPDNYLKICFLRQENKEDERILEFYPYGNHYMHIVKEVLSENFKH